MMVGGYWTTSTVPVQVIIGTHEEYMSVWGVVGGYMAWQGDDIWGIVGSHQEVQETWIPEVRSSFTETVYSVPVVKLTGLHADTVWSWLNDTREVLEVSNAGLLVPHPGDTVGAHKAMLTATQLEQSYTTPHLDLGDYLSYGVKVAKDGIETWQDTGEDQIVANSSTAKIKPTELLIERKVPGVSGVTVNVVGTRIAATDASFGGNIKVSGAILIPSQGDIDMGPFTNGQKPWPEANP